MSFVKGNLSFSNLFSTIFFFGFVYLVFFTVYAFLIFGINGHFNIFNDLFCIIIAMLLACGTQILIMSKLKRKFIRSDSPYQVNSIKIFLILLITFNLIIIILISLQLRNVFTSVGLYSSDYNAGEVLEQNFDELTDSTNENHIDPDFLRTAIEQLKDTAYKGWSVYKNPDIGFKIRFPGDFRDSMIIKLIKGKKKELKYWVSINNPADDPNYAYALTVIKEPGYQTEKAVDSLMNMTRDNFLIISNAALLSENIIEKMPYAGRSLYISIDNSDLRVNAHIYYKDPYLFEITVFTREGKYFNSKISKFIDGFEFLN